MAFNRERFKAAKLEANKAVTKEVEQTFKFNSQRGDYHSIDKGINVFRMMPPHDENEASIQPKVVYWLTCKVPKMDGEGNEIQGEFEEKQRPIFDSRIHGGTPKDIIDEYIKFTKNNIFESIQDKEERQKRLAPITGFKDKKEKWTPGIQPSKSFVCYATKGDITPANLGRLELYAQDKEELEKLNIDDESGEPIAVDIFSDPDEGVQFVINRVLNDKGKMINVISKKTFSVPRGVSKADYGKLYDEFLQSQVVPDEVLKKLDEMDPLSKQFKDAYKRKDFEKALVALQMFDKKNKYNTFDNDEFLDIVQEIDGYYPNEELDKALKSNNTTNNSTSKPKSKPVVKDEEEEEESRSKELSLEEMNRDQLKEYIKQNSLPIKVMKSMNDEAIREAIQDALNPSSEEEEEEESTGKDELPWEQEEIPWDNAEKDEKVAAGVSSSLKDRLAKLRK